MSHPPAHFIFEGRKQCGTSKFYQCIKCRHVYAVTAQMQRARSGKHGAYMTRMVPTVSVCHDERVDEFGFVLNYKCRRKLPGNVVFSSIRKPKLHERINISYRHKNFHNDYNRFITIKMGSEARIYSALLHKKHALSSYIKENVSKWLWQYP